jgi:hypothetical protein
MFEAGTPPAEISVCKPCARTGPKPLRPDAPPGRQLFVKAPVFAKNPIHPKQKLDFSLESIRLERPIKRLSVEGCLPGTPLW